MVVRIASSDRLIAEARAIQEAMDAGGRRARVIGAYLSELPDQRGVWVVLVSFSRARRGP